MATLRDIKRKISSIDSTQTITRTMKMVSASKLRRAQAELEKTKAYARQDGRPREEGGRRNFPRVVIRCSLRER